MPMEFHVIEQMQTAIEESMEKGCLGETRMEDQCDYVWKRPLEDYPTPSFGKRPGGSFSFSFASESGPLGS